eukprot:XP_025006948.1 von Willebrand factor C and EGF domain-containing protein isoform X7 [Gallus gallus]
MLVALLVRAACASLLLPGGQARVYSGRKKPASFAVERRHVGPHICFSAFGSGCCPGWMLAPGSGQCVLREYGRRGWHRVGVPAPSRSRAPQRSAPSAAAAASALRPTSARAPTESGASPAQSRWGTAGSTAATSPVTTVGARRWPASVPSASPWWRRTPASAATIPTSAWPRRASTAARTAWAATAAPAGPATTSTGTGTPAWTSTSAGSRASAVRASTRATTHRAASSAPAGPATGSAGTGCPAKASPRPSWRPPPSCSPCSTPPRWSYSLPERGDPSRSLLLTSPPRHRARPFLPPPLAMPSSRPLGLPPRPLSAGTAGLPGSRELAGRSRGARAAAVSWGLLSQLHRLPEQWGGPRRGRGLHAVRWKLHHLRVPGRQYLLHLPRVPPRLLPQRLTPQLLLLPARWGPTRGDRVAAGGCDARMGPWGGLSSPSQPSLPPSCPAKCSFRGRTYAHGARFSLDGDECTTCVCRSGEVECSFAPCPVLDCPQQQRQLRPGQCCFSCKDPPRPSGCFVDDNGVEFPIGQIWSPGDPCELCVCQADGSVSCKRTDCVETCPYPIHIPGQCCPDCSAGCTYMGRIFYNNETFPSLLDPCLSCICLLGSVACSPVDCAIFCTYPFHPEGECCPVCKDCNYEGRKVVNGQSFSPEGRPCTRCTCQLGEVSCEERPCPQSCTEPTACCPPCQADGQLQSSDTSPSLSPSPTPQPSSQSSSPSPSPSPSSSPSPSHEGTPQSPRHRLAQVLLHTTPLSPSLGGEPPPNAPSPPSGCPGEATGSPALSSSPSSRQDAQEHPEDVDMDT